MGKGKGKGKGLTVLALQQLHAEHKKREPGFVISGSTMVQAVLGVEWTKPQFTEYGGRPNPGPDNDGGSDIDLFCTPDAAPAVRTVLMESGYVLGGFPDDYEDNGNGSTAPLLESRVHHVECYAPVNSISIKYQGVFDLDIEQAREDGAIVSANRTMIPISNVTHPLAFKPTDQHIIRCLPGTSLLYNFDWKRSKQVDLIVGEVGCEDAKELLDSFDILICKCSFDGNIFRIPDPHLTFNMKTKMDPVRKGLMEALCSITTDVPSEWEWNVVTWEEVCKLSPVLKDANIRWRSANKSDYDHEEAQDEIFYGDEEAIDHIPHLYYSNFLKRLFKRHQKYSKRGIEFVDKEAHDRFMDINIKIETIPCMN
jgi:hypothetical protein